MVVNLSNFRPLIKKTICHFRNFDKDFCSFFIDNLSEEDKKDYMKIITTCWNKCSCSTEDVSKKKIIFLANEKHNS